MGAFINRPVSNELSAGQHNLRPTIISTLAAAAIVFSAFGAAPASARRFHRPHFSFHPHVPRPHIPRPHPFHSFSNKQQTQTVLTYADNTGRILGIAGLFYPPVGAIGTYLRYAVLTVRFLDPSSDTLLSGRATIQLAPDEQIVAAGWFGEFGADPLLPAPPTSLAMNDPTWLQSDPNPAMISSSIAIDNNSNRVVFAFDWGAGGFAPTRNTDDFGHFNFAAIYSFSPDPDARHPFGEVESEQDIFDNGINADTYALCSFGFCSSTVPEPTSWAMLIAGFGLIGAVTRRRRWSMAQG